MSGYLCIANIQLGTNWNDIPINSRKKIIAFDIDLGHMFSAFPIEYKKYIPNFTGDLNDELTSSRDFHKRIAYLLSKS